MGGQNSILKSSAYGVIKMKDKHQDSYHKRLMKSRAIVNHAYLVGRIYEIMPIIVGFVVSLLCILTSTYLCFVHPQRILSSYKMIMFCISFVPSLVGFFIFLKNKNHRKIARIFVDHGLGRLPWRARNLVDSHIEEARKIPPTVKKGMRKNEVIVSNFRPKTNVQILKDVKQFLEYETKREVASLTVENSKNELTITYNSLPLTLPLGAIPPSLANAAFVGIDHNEEPLWWYFTESSLYDIRGASGSGKSVHGSCLAISAYQGLVAGSRKVHSMAVCDPKAGSHIAKLGFSRFIDFDPSDFDDLQKLCVWFDEVHEFYMSLEDKTHPSERAYILVLEEAERYLCKKDTHGKEMKELSDRLTGYVNRWSALYRSVGWPCILITQSMDADSIDIKRTNLSMRSLGSAINPALSQAITGDDSLFNPTLTKGKWSFVDRCFNRTGYMRSPYSGAPPSHWNNVCDRKNGTKP
jgi:uncharacterized membrane protein